MKNARTDAGMAGRRPARRGRKRRSSRRKGRIVIRLAPASGGGHDALLGGLGRGDDAATLPPANTRMRSAQRSSSGSSELARITPLAAASSTMMREISCLAPTSMPRAGSSRNSSGRRPHVPIQAALGIERMNYRGGAPPAVAGTIPRFACAPVWMSIHSGGA